jgi:hypothetical protein
MTIPETYEVKEIEKSLAQKINVENHYLHRKAPCMQSFGLFQKANGKLVGILMFGVSASSTLLKGICGPDEAKNVLELTRLWIEDGTPKNTESYFIAQCLKRAAREIIVSFAQNDVGHVGTVYQATNWLYTGLSSKFKDPKHKGQFKNQHHTSWAHGMTNKQIIEKWGHEVFFQERSRKHRYVFFNCNKIRKKDLLKKLRYKIQNYPKKDLS